MAHPEPTAEPAPVPDPGAGVSGARRKLPGPARRAGPGSWVAYGLAWLPAVAIYTAMFVADGEGSLRRAAVTAFLNVGSAAALGLPVLRRVRTRTWPPDHPGRFLASHLLGACVYAVAWAGAVMGLVSVRGLATTGVWDPLVLRGPALRWQLFAGLMVYGAIAGVAHAVASGRRLAAERTRSAELESLRVQSELRALRSRLNPHFLFNALHSVQALVRESAPRAEEALELVADVLRYATRADDLDTVTLRRELEVVRGYLELEKLRMGERLRVARAVEPAALDASVPPVTVQPLVENAVRHGLAPTGDGGTVRIGAEVAEGDDGPRLVVEVSDDGRGADPETVGGSSGGLGLRLVRERLSLRYGDRASVSVDTAPGEGFSAVLSFPAGTGAAPPGPTAAAGPGRRAEAARRPGTSGDGARRRSG